MKKIALLAAVAVAISAAMPLTAAPAGAQEVKLKAASFLPRRIIYARFFWNWTRAVNKACRGKVSITVVGPAAIRSLEQWNALKNGVIDMHYGPSAYYKGVAPMTETLLLAENSPAEWRKNGAWEMIDKRHREKMNAVFLTTMMHGLPFYLYTTKSAKGMDFSGFRLRSVPTYDAFFKSLGAQRVRLGAPALYTALERGTVNGYGWPLWGTTTFGWHKFTKYRYGPGFFTVSINVLVNQDKWKSMTEDQRACLQKMAEQHEAAWASFREKQNAREIAAQKKAGIKYVDLGPGFRKRAHDAAWGEYERIDPDFTKKIRPLLTK